MMFVFNWLPVIAFSVSVAVVFGCIYFGFKG